MTVSLLVISDREPLSWLLTEQRWALTTGRAAKAPAEGDELLLYTTRGCYRNPTRDRGLVMGRATVTSEPKSLPRPVVFREQSRPASPSMSQGWPLCTLGRAGAARRVADVLARPGYLERPPQAIADPAERGRRRICCPGAARQLAAVRGRRFSPITGRQPSSARDPRCGEADEGTRVTGVCDRQDVPSTGGGQHSNERSRSSASVSARGLVVLLVLGNRRDGPLAQPEQEELDRTPCPSTGASSSRPAARAALPLCPRCGPDAPLGKPVDHAFLLEAISHQDRQLSLARCRQPTNQSRSWLRRPAHPQSRTLGAPRPQDRSARSGSPCDPRLPLRHRGSQPRRAPTSPSGVPGRSCDSSAAGVANGRHANAVRRQGDSLAVDALVRVLGDKEVVRPLRDGGAQQLPPGGREVSWPSSTSTWSNTLPLVSACKSRCAVARAATSSKSTRP